MSASYSGWLKFEPCETETPTKAEFRPWFLNFPLSNTRVWGIGMLIIFRSSLTFR